jgi:hypothetical protein
MFGGATGSPGRVGLVAAGADANISLVLQPKGTGALVAQAPDNMAAGGNMRGANAVDWQTSRTNAAHVASGANSTIGGGNINTASGTLSTVAGGDGNLASGLRGTISGGRANQANGSSSWIPGGAFATTRSHEGRGAWSAGQFTAQGDAQAGEFVLRRETTDATATRLTADNAAPSTVNTVNLPNNGTYRLKLLVVAQQTGGSAGTAGDCASWEANVLIKRGASAASTSFVGGTVFAAGATLAAVTAGTALAPGLNDAAAAAWRITLAADTANGGLAVSGTGEANKTIRWAVRALSAELTA